MAIKYILVQFSDRTWWKIPAKIIAESRAKYFAEHDAAIGDGTYDEVYKEEYEITINDSVELEDWAKNSMDWEDVKEFAVQDRSEDADYEKEWCNTEFDFIEE